LIFAWSDPNPEYWRKIGQRDLNKGEIYFDEVRIPKEWMFVDPDFYVPICDIILTSAISFSFATALSRVSSQTTFERNQLLSLGFGNKYLKLRLYLCQSFFKK
jgi:hypothetical protein